ncbi:hypothetical protein F7P10_16195 [Actinomadura sp. WMMB 499]|nr:hypothetical protein F7P10_16195 [Actinomadura sp. WMMB 499]
MVRRRQGNAARRRGFAGRRRRGLRGGGLRGGGGQRPRQHRGEGEGSRGGCPLHLLPFLSRRRVRHQP